MRITASQLRRIIRQEVRALHEMPRGRAARPVAGPGALTIVTKQVPAGFHASLYISGYEPGEVAKAFQGGVAAERPDLRDALYMAHGRKGVAWKTANEAISSLYGEVASEARSLGRKQAAEPGRVRPNEALRLELLSQAVSTWDTLPVKAVRIK